MKPKKKKLTSKPVSNMPLLPAKPPKGKTITDAILKRWLAGESPAILAPLVGFKPSKFRRLCRQAAGAARPERVSKASKRVARQRGETIQNLRVNDSNAVIIDSALGWTARRKQDLVIFLDPASGKEYVQASPFESATMIYDHGTLGLPPYRLVRYTGHDMHTVTAAKMFNVDPDDVTPKQRAEAKKANFAKTYGQAVTVEDDV